MTVKRGILFSHRGSIRSINIIIAIMLWAAIVPLVSAELAKPSGPPLEWIKPWTPPKVPADYRSPGEPHKILVRTGDAAQLSILRKIPALKVYQYPKRRLFLLSGDTFNRLPTAELKRLNIRDDQNLIRLRDRFFDTTITPPEVPEEMRLSPRPGPQLYLFQFVGPVQDDWLTALREMSGVQIVNYFPENAYLVWVDQAARAELATKADIQPYVQWQGPFHPDYKLHPSFDLGFGGNVQATVQLFTNANIAQSIEAIRAKSIKVLKEPHRVSVFTNMTIEIPASELKNIARLDDVVNVEPFIEPRTFGERQGQIVAGSVNVAGTGPGGPGYLAWLNGLGFNSNFGFAIDISDDGFDRGDTAAANVHPVFRDAGGASRVVYVRRVTGTTISTTNDQNRGGHGTINASIAAGFNNTPAAAADFDYHGDGTGYRYGLGVAPYALLGASKILDPWSNPDFTTLIDSAYSNSARISSNSWGAGCNTLTGCCDPGLLGDYTASSQEYDELVRDARPSTAPSGGEDGNQEMTIVFSAGNHGTCVNEQLGNNGSTAKNTIVVGASENFNATGAVDGSGIGNNGANDRRQVIFFSSTGPTVDGRTRPDLMAPGTHVFGAASQDASFDGDSVSGAPGNIPSNGADEGAGYYPPDPDATDTTDQTLYTWSSGTSQSAPAVAGGAALLRQWFLDHGHPAPSPAMTKAYLMNTATYMTGPGDDLYSDNQGNGLLNLGRSFDNTPRLLFDQVKTSHSTAATEVFTVNGQVADPTLPFRITMAYTDAAGTPGAGVIRENDLDLEVQVGGNFYRGNDFNQDVSNVGAVADPPDDLNNVESVFLPAGTAGNFTVTVRPTSVNSDGVPNNGDPSDQDFSLVIYNAEFPARNPVDIILVLDVSGSMDGIAPGGTMPKIDLLKDAVEMFIRTWEPFSIPEDRMGIVYFSDAIQGTYPPLPATPLLLPFQTNANNFITNVRAQTAHDCTALGGGILTALRGFDTVAGRQRHIVVFTNGMQNRSPMVTSTSPHQILADPSASCGDSGIADEPGANIADYGVKAIHTIGTGTPGAWRTLLTDIASEAGGEDHFTTTPDENLEDFFLDDLVAVLRVDPVEKVATKAGTLTNADSGKTETFEVNSTVRKATFAVSWRGDRRAGAVNYSLVAPDGTTIPPRLIHSRSGPFYRVASVDFPLSVHGTPVNHAGTWQLVFQPQLATSQVSYRAHLIVDDADMRYHFDVPTAGTGVGEPIPLSLWVQQDNRTLTGLSNVRATITRPPMGFGTFMVNNAITQDQLDQPIAMSGDKFGRLAEKKGLILYQQDDLRQSLAPISETIQLYDDGLSEHGDAKANDGVYSALYTHTMRPGFYHAALSFQLGVIDDGATMSRTDERTIAVGMEQYDLTKSLIDIRSVLDPEGGTAYDVRVVLIDKYDNYLGPGHDISAIVALPGDKWGGRRVLLRDNLDGSYSGRVTLTSSEVGAGASVRLEVGDETITRVPFPPASRFAVSAHMGSTVPQGTYGNNYDSGLSLVLDYEYRYRPDLSAVVLLGYNRFAGGAAGTSDTYWWNLSANVKYHFNQNVWQPFVNGGIGIYIPETGSNKPGVNVGGGVDYLLRPDLTLELGVDYHNIFTTGSDVKYVVPHIGLVYRY